MTITGIHGKLPLNTLLTSIFILLRILLYFDMNTTSLSRIPLFKLKESSKEQERSLFSWLLPGDWLHHEELH